MGERTERFHVDIEATPADVWRMLTTAEGLAAWLGTRARIDLRVGGDVEVGWAPDDSSSDGTSDGPGDVIASRITALEPHRRLRLAHLADGEEVGAEEWLVTTHGPTTRLTLVHSMPDDGIEDWDGFYGDMRRGWRLFLASLRHALESAATPLRTATTRSLPMPGGRPRIWADLTAAVGLEDDHATAPLLADMVVVLADPPHSLLLASPSRTLLCDVEGPGDQQVLYLQAAVHAGPPDWARTVLDDLASTVGAPDLNGGPSMWHHRGDTKGAQMTNQPPPPSGNAPAGGGKDKDWRKDMQSALDDVTASLKAAWEGSRGARAEALEAAKGALASLGNAMDEASRSAREAWGGEGADGSEQDPSADVPPTSPPATPASSEAPMPPETGDATDDDDPGDTSGDTSDDEHGAG